MRISDPTPPSPTPVADLTSQLAASFAGGVSNPGPAIPATSFLTTFGTNTAGFDTAAAQDVFLSGAALPTQSVFHFTLDFTLPDSSVRGQASLLHVLHDPAASTTLDRSYWQADADIAMPGQSESRQVFTVQTNSDQPGLLLKSVQTMQAPLFSPGASSFFDMFVELQYDGLAPINPSQPILWLSTTTVPEPAISSIAISIGIACMRRRR